MPRRMRHIALVLTVLAGLAIAGGLSSCAKPEPYTVRYAVMPVLENLPIFVGVEEGLFAKRGLTVELIPVQSAVERDALLRGGGAEGALLDPIAIALFNKDEVTMIGVRLVNDPASGKFAIIASPESGVTAVGGLAGVPVGVAFNTITEYVADVMLRDAGVPAESINLAEWRQINVRLEAVINGQLACGVFPEPYATYALEHGCVLLARDSELGGLAPDILCLSAKLASENPDRAKAFLKAYEEAVKLIRDDPSRWDSLIEEQGLVPPMISGPAPLPTYSGPVLPSEELLRPVMEWAAAKGLIPSVPPIDKLVSPDYLPGG